MALERLSDENGRLAALYRYQILDTPPEAAFQHIVDLVCLSLDVPCAALSFFDSHRQVFKAVSGLPRRDIARSLSACQFDPPIQGYALTPHREALYSPNTSLDERCARDPRMREAPFARSYLAVPLVSVDGYPIGALEAMDVKERTFDTGQLKTLRTLAALVIEQLELRQTNTRDPLTSTLSRRGFYLDVEREFVRALRYERPAALMVLDLDHFHKINDAFGHQVGDEALKAVANRCLEVMRQSDSAGRVGGEEFAFLLPETSAREAMQCAERIREIIEKLRFRIGSEVLSITASFGVSALHPHMTGAALWLAEADTALYEAKRLGRNCAVLSARPATPGDGFSPNTHPLSPPARLN